MFVPCPIFFGRCWSNRFALYSLITFGYYFAEDTGHRRRAWNDPEVSGKIGKPGGRNFFKHICLTLWPLSLKFFLKTVNNEQCIVVIIVSYDCGKES